MDTVLCLDTSGSMAGQSLRELKAAVLTYTEFTEKVTKFFQNKNFI